MDYYKIGQRIRKCRKSLGLSQEELAEQVDISTTHMSHIETGNTKLSLPVLVRIAQVLEISTDDLLSDRTTASKSSKIQAISSILETCSPEQVHIINDIVRAAKQSMDKHL